MSVSIDGTNGLTFSDSSTLNTGGYTGFRNRIINGDMRIDQRNAGAAFTQTTSNQYTLDRYYIVGSVTSKFTVQQNAGSVTPPTGFTKYLGVTSSAATTPGTNDFYFVSQPIEGQNIADLGWGTASAQAISVSFWVRSSLTGTFNIAIGNDGYGRGYAATYTIAAANTWEYKTISIPGDTTGTWLTTNGVGIRVLFNLGSGSGQTQAAANSWGTWSGPGAPGVTNVIGTNGATFFVTGVQLEKGSVATPFEYRPYGTELALCQRYYIKFSDSGSGFTPFASGVMDGTSQASVVMTLPVEMRATPTFTYSSLQISSSSALSISSVVVIRNSQKSVGVVFLTSAGTQGHGAILRAANSTSGYLDLSSEL